MHIIGGHRQCGQSNDRFEVQGGGDEGERVTGEIEAIHDLAARVRAVAQARFHRGVLVLAGEAAWCRAAGAAIVASAAGATVLWVGEQAPAGVTRIAGSGAGGMLGQEVDLLVFDAHSGFDVDAFGAVTGTVRGGGLSLLLTPPLAGWPAFADPEHARIAVYPCGALAVGGRFIGRLVRVLRAAEAVRVVEQGRAVAAVGPDAEVGPVRPMGEGLYRTPDQAQAVEALLKVVTGHRRRPLVLTSDRGRGKSAALGIAAAQLLRQGVRTILVTAPRPEAVAPLFAHAARLLPEAHTSHGVVRLGEAAIEFAAPDALCRDPRPANLLLVDEAAAIPAPMLEQLLEHYSRIAFATTVHGYEGTGRGFAVRFQQVLDRRTPEWKALRLTTPIRWAADDPLERLTFRALLLDAAAAPDQAVAAATPESCTFERLERDALAADEATLGELFGLLVLAHYRTRPLDLRHLLDGPNVTVQVARFRGHVVAVALLAAEGGFDEAAARAVWAGRSRPHGHLLPESLATHLGLRAAPGLRCTRLLRVAVHPAAQGRGLGSALVARVVAEAAAGGDDYVGSSFGATPELLRFWDRCGMEPVRVSVRRGDSSGAHSVIVLRALSEGGAALWAAARRNLTVNLPHLLADTLADLDPALALPLLRGDARVAAPPLDGQAWLDVVAFAWGRRVYEVCVGTLWTLAVAGLTDPAAAARLTAQEQTVLLAKIVQRRDWAETARVLGVPGRQQVVTLLRRAFRPLLAHWGGPDVLAEARVLAAMWGEEG